jgi:hypothetical protein
VKPGRTEPKPPRSGRAPATERNGGRSHRIGQEGCGIAAAARRDWEAGPTTSASPVAWSPLQHIYLNSRASRFQRELSGRLSRLRARCRSGQSLSKDPSRALLGTRFRISGSRRGKVARARTGREVVGTRQLCSRPSFDSPAQPAPVSESDERNQCAARSATRPDASRVPTPRSKRRPWVQHEADDPAAADGPYFLAQLHRRRRAPFEVPRAHAGRLSSSAIREVGEEQ